MVEALTLGMEFSQIKFLCFTPSQNRARALSLKLIEKGAEAEFVPDFKTLFNKLNEESLYLIMIGCKPQQFSLLVKNLKEADLLSHPKFMSATAISLMAGVSHSLLKKSWNKEVVRLMPNTPSKIGEGVLLFSSSKKLHSTLLDIFRPCGLTHSCQDEEELKILTPYCASGPGLLFKIMDLWQKDLQQRGIPHAVSGKLLAKTMQGSGTMLFNSSDSAQVLCDQVTSKGGVTFAALKVLGENNIDTIFKQAFDSALSRNNEIEEQISQELSRNL